MRKNIVLSWDAETGMVYDARDTYVGCNLNLEPTGDAEASTRTQIEDLVKLRNAGFTTDEIIELKRKELI
jgi:hypothetical protein